jgi:hypothetical protein
MDSGVGGLYLFRCHRLVRLEEWRIDQDTGAGARPSPHIFFLTSSNSLIQLLQPWSMFVHYFIWISWWMMHTLLTWYWYIAQPPQPRRIERHPFAQCYTTGQKLFWSCAINILTHYQFLRRNSTKVITKLIFVTYLFYKIRVLFWRTIWTVNSNTSDRPFDPGELDLSSPKRLQEKCCGVWRSKSNSTITITRQSHVIELSDI